MTPKEAYDCAVLNGYSSDLENIVMQDPIYAYKFAVMVKGADVNKLFYGSIMKSRKALWALASEMSGVER